MAEKKVIEIEIQDNTKTLKAQYREAVQEVQKLVQAYGETSQEAAEAAKRAAELKDQIEDTNDAIAAFKGEGVFNATGKAISSVASGFSAVEGAMGLVGVESEDLQKTLLRVQSAMALAQGLEGLEDAGRAFGQLKTVAVTAFQGMTTASKVFLATGIGLLIAGLATVVAYWDDISKAIGLTTKEQEAYAKQQKAIAENTKKQAEFIGKESAEFATLISRLKDTNKGSKERKELIKDINNQYGTTLKNMSNETEFQKQLNVELENYLEFQRQKFNLQKNEELIGKNLQKQSELKAKIVDKEKEIKNATKEYYDLIRAGVTIEKSDTAIPKLMSELNELKQSLTDAEQRFLNYGKQANKASAEIDNLTNGGKKYVQNLKATSSEEKYILDDRMLKQKQMDDENLERLKEYTEGEKIKLKTTIEIADGVIAQYQRELEHAKFVADEQRRIDDETAQRRKRNIEFTADAIAQTFSIIAQLTQANDKMSEKQARRAFNINKMAQIGQATATTYLSATKAYASQIIPGDPTSVVRGKIAAGLAIASGLANVAMITRQQFNAPSTSGGGSMSASSGGGIVAPNLNVVGDTGINQLAQLGQTPIKAYVVSNDITTAQMFDLKVQQTASL